MPRRRRPQACRPAHGLGPELSQSVPREPRSRPFRNQRAANHDPSQSVAPGSKQGNLFRCHNVDRRRFLRVGDEKTVRGGAAGRPTRKSPRSTMNGSTCRSSKAAVRWRGFRSEDERQAIRVIGVECPTAHSACGSKGDVGIAHAHGRHGDALGAHRRHQFFEAASGRLSVGEEDDVFDPASTWRITSQAASGRRGCSFPRRP